MLRKTVPFLLAGLSFALALPAPAKIANLKGKEPFVPGEILVRFKDGASTQDRDKALAAVGAAQPLDRQVLFKVKLKAGLDIQGAVDQMKSNPAVQYAQPNYRYYALGTTCALPADQYVSIYSTNASWPFLKIHMDEAVTLFNGWPSCPPGTASVTVAVLDSGVSRLNPDLRAVTVAAGYNAIGAVGEQDSSCTSCGVFPPCNTCAYSGTSFTDPPGLSGPCTYSMDDFGHGTYVAGIIGAEWNVTNLESSEVGSCNDSPVTGTSGYAGVAPGCALLAVKVLDCTGSGTTDSIVAGTNYAVAHGARVLNFSLGSSPQYGIDPAEQEAIDNALANNCVVVAASGNESTSGNLAPVDYPAAYPPVVSVGATDQNNNLAVYSNGGANLKLVAPGGLGAAAMGAGFQPEEDVFSDFLCPLSSAAASEGGFAPASDSNFGAAAGTSAATPFVSGAAALIMSVYPGLTNTQVIQAILNNTDSLNGNKGWNPQTGYGLLNVYQALLNAANGSGQTTPYLETFNSPNPFYTKTNGSTNITLAISQPAAVELTICDTSGQVVLHKNYDPRQLDNNPSNPQFKSYYVSWDGKNGLGQPVVTGIYFYSVKANGQIGRNKIALIQGSK